MYETILISVGYEKWDDAGIDLWLFRLTSIISQRNGSVISSTHCYMDAGYSAFWPKERSQQLLMYGMTPFTEPLPEYNSSQVTVRVQGYCTVILVLLQAHPVRRYLQHFAGAFLNLVLALALPLQILSRGVSTGQEIQDSLSHPGTSSWKLGGMQGFLRPGVLREEERWGRWARPVVSYELTVCLICSWVQFKHYVSIGKALRSNAANNGHHA